MREKNKKGNATNRAWWRALPKAEKTEWFRKNKRSQTKHKIKSFSNESGVQVCADGREGAGNNLKFELLWF